MTVDIDEIWYILRNYDVDQNILKEILYKLYDNVDFHSLDDMVNTDNDEQPLFI